MNWKNMKNIFEFTSLIEKHYNDVFPKVCPKCEKNYHSLDDFLTNTKNIASAITKVKSGEVDIINVHCCCVSCGHVFSFDIDERRDISKKGCYIRNKFKEIIEMLMDEGMSKEDARKEVLKLFDEQEHAFPRSKKK